MLEHAVHKVALCGKLWRLVIRVNVLLVNAMSYV